MICDNKTLQLPQTWMEAADDRRASNWRDCCDGCPKFLVDVRAKWRPQDDHGRILSGYIRFGLFNDSIAALHLSQTLYLLELDGFSMATVQSIKVTLSSCHGRGIISSHYFVSTPCPSGLISFAYNLYESILIRLWHGLLPLRFDQLRAHSSYPYLRPYYLRLPTPHHRLLTLLSSLSRRSLHNDTPLCPFPLPHLKQPLHPAPISRRNLLSDPTNRPRHLRLALVLQSFIENISTLRSFRLLSERFALFGVVYLFPELYVFNHRTSLDKLQAISGHPFIKTCVRSIVYETALVPRIMSK